MSHLLHLNVKKKIIILILIIVYLFNTIKIQCSFKKVPDKGCKLKKYHTFVKYQVILL